MTLPEHLSLTIHHNEHKVYYTPIEEAVKEEDRLECWISPEERQKALETGDIWIMHWYPRTPIGFHRCAASTLEALLAYVNDPTKAFL